ncbi:MAG: nucleotidyltransferase domain-containing protein, partial [Firmicutes bacterium]|nr:nucleotidyltransferase domain-containing protein [Bacillota bacterium]
AGGSRRQARAGIRRASRPAPGATAALVRRALEGRADVDAAYLFGSQARGTARRRSDVDVAVLFSAGLDPVERLERRLDLIVALEDRLARPVDVVDMESIPCVLAHQVLKHGVLLFDRNPRRRIAVEVRHRRAYLDGQRRRAAYFRALVTRLRADRREGDALR